MNLVMQAEQIQEAVQALKVEVERLKCNLLLSYDKSATDHLAQLDEKVVQLSKAMNGEQA